MSGDEMKFQRENEMKPSNSMITKRKKKMYVSPSYEILQAETESILCLSTGFDDDAGGPANAPALFFND